MHHLRAGRKTVRPPDQTTASCRRQPTGRTDGFNPCRDLRSDGHSSEHALPEGCAMNDHDPTRCPACGETNRCQTAAGPGERCWCFDLTLPREAVSPNPDDWRRACLCQRCLERLAGADDAT
ncbi:cysteine-rich CWC family protein [Stutzerimonas urumqiensis]|uniref:cysteine-rich CWC family protein n=1 Tax=Stutzerimonas urumqiensis TaxID=638269 RepID=UPI003DA456A8